MNAIDGEDCSKLTAKINPFNESTSRKCKEASDFRRTEQLKYKEINIPPVVDASNGFHLTCYKKVTSFSKKQREKFADFLNKENNESSTECDTKRGLRSSNTSTITSPSPSSGIFKKVCFICDKENRKHRGTRLPLILSTKGLEKSILDIVIKLNDNALITKLEIDKENRTICDFVAKECTMLRVGYSCKGVPSKKLPRVIEPNGTKSGMFILRPSKQSRQ